VLSSSNIGVLPAFRVAGNLPQVVLKSGSFTTLLSSRFGPLVEAGFDADQVAAAADSAPTAIAARDAAIAARDAALSVPATTDGLMAAVQADSDSAFVLQQRVAIDSRISAVGAGGSQLATPADSITAARQNDPDEGSVISWASLISEWAGINVFNPSVPGERQGDIATRYGNPIRFTVPGGVIPISGSFSVTLVEPAATNFIGSADPNPQSYFEGTFLGAPVWVRYSGAAWTMGRLDSATVAKPVPASGGVFRVSSARGVQSAILVSFGGRNGSTASLIAQTREMLLRMPEPRRALLIPPLFRTAIVGNDSGLADLAGEFAEGVHFLDLRTYLAAHGLDDEGVTHTAQDDLDIAAGTIPESLFLDGVHPTAAGQRAIARRVLEELIDLGWIDAAAVEVPARVIPLPVFTGPTHLFLPIGGEAILPTGDAFRDAQQLDVMIHVEPRTMVSQGILSRGAVIDGLSYNSFALQTLSSGVIRSQIFNTSDRTVWQGNDSDLPSYPAGAYSLRITTQANPREVKFYLGPPTNDFDSVTWTQIGATKTTGGNTSFYPRDGLPLRLALDGSWWRVLIKTGSTVLVDQDFTDPEATYPGWSFLGGAAIVED
jgi:hypothetical protein